MGFSIVSIFLGSGGVGMLASLFARQVALDRVLHAPAPEALALLLLPEVGKDQHREEGPDLDAVGDQVANDLNLARIQSCWIDEWEVRGELDDLGYVLVDLVDDHRRH